MEGQQQDTVTAFTREAELLALAQAAKESLCVSRLLVELSVVLENKQGIRTQCDNQQTIRPAARTKFRHVHIHNHWPRREAAQRGIQSTPSNDMTTDGFTKALPKGTWKRFLTQLGRQDISQQLKHEEWPMLQTRRWRTAWGCWN